MAERYLPQQGLMWIRLNPGERPIWIGGDYHVAPEPSIAHLFANTRPTRREVDEGALQRLRDRARRTLQEDITELMQSGNGAMEGLLERGGDIEFT